MEIQSIIVRKRLFKGLDGGWSRLMSIEEFILKYSDSDEREKVLSDQSRIKFISYEGEVCEHNQGLSNYKILESRHLDAYLKSALESGQFSQTNFKFSQ